MALFPCVIGKKLPSEYNALFCCASSGQWTYTTIPKDIAKQYSKITIGAKTGTLSNAKYGSFDIDSPVASYSTLDSALTNSVTIGTATNITGVNDDLVIGAFGSGSFVAKVTLSN